MKFGYARVSTDEQHLDLQLQALRAHGCQFIYSDRGVSGVTFDRPGLKEALDALVSGTTLVVWRLDRLGRSLTQLADLIETLNDRQVRVVSLTEHLDTGSSSGRFVFHMLSALAEFERDIISERTRAGMAAARDKGQHVGRPAALAVSRIEEARALLQTQPAESVARALNVHRTTLWRYVKKACDKQAA
ncbi:recombinase family protein [Burkholderia sp. Ac-20345]|uniref:recombinase family protein n=1 Tax=Burkholderia sp. Ac-20345 TaxID=2703891 RepID=UPI00197B1F82|nr:recombinase family protein [Burkholderia sp. Ac-20345]MBN3778991.1 recombinase family protein [Burkholderia sp. Ac-20345]